MCVSTVFDDHTFQRERFPTTKLLFYTLDALKGKEILFIFLSDFFNASKGMLHCCTGFVKKTSKGSPQLAHKNRYLETMCYKMHALPNSVATLFNRTLKAHLEDLLPAYVHNRYLKLVNLEEEKENKTKIK